MREDRDAALQRAHPRDDAVGTGCHVGGHFAAGAAIAPDAPARPREADVHRALTFVGAVVPFRQIGIDFDAAAQTGQCAGSPGAQARARQHLREFDLAQHRRKISRLRFASGGQVEISVARVLAAQRPGSVAMPNEVKLGLHLSDLGLSRDAHA
jgi:hypothetical protein